MVDWEESGLPRGIVGLLGEPRTLTELADVLDVTDARVPEERVVEFHERLLSLVGEYFAPDRVDRAASPKYGFRWC